MKRGLVLSAVLTILVVLAFAPSAAETTSCHSGPATVAGGSCSIELRCDAYPCNWTGSVVAEGLGLVTGHIEGNISQECFISNGLTVQPSSCQVVDFLGNPVPLPTPSDGDADDCGPTVLRCEATASGALRSESKTVFFGPPFPSTFIIREIVTITCSSGGLSLSAHVSCYGSTDS